MAEFPDDMISTSPTISPFRAHVVKNEAVPTKPTWRKDSGYRWRRAIHSATRLRYGSPVIALSPDGASLAIVRGLGFGAALGGAGLRGGSGGLGTTCGALGAGSDGCGAVSGSAVFGGAGVGSGAVFGAGSLAEGAGLGGRRGGSSVGADVVRSSGPDSA